MKHLVAEGNETKNKYEYSEYYIKAFQCLIIFYSLPILT